MKKLCVLGSLLVALTACTPLPPAANNVPSTFVILGAPLNSEEGQIKLLVLQHLSETVFKDNPKILFLPLTEPEIQQVRANFSHDIRPGTQAEYATGRDVMDKSTKEEGFALEAQDVRMNDNEANVVGGFLAATGETLYNFRLVKMGQAWRVQDFTFLSTINVPSAIAPQYPNSFTRPPGRRF